MQVNIAIFEVPNTKERRVMVGLTDSAGDLSTNFGLSPKDAKAIGEQLLKAAEAAESRIVKPGPGPGPAGGFRKN